MANLSKKRKYKVIYTDPKTDPAVFNLCLDEFYIIDGCLIFWPKSTNLRTRFIAAGQWKEFILLDN